MPDSEHMNSVLRLLVSTWLLMVNSLVPNRTLSALACQSLGAAIKGADDFCMPNCETSTSRDTRGM